MARLCVEPCLCERDWNSEPNHQVKIKSEGAAFILNSARALPKAKAMVLSALFD
jgi:hypothetical protein